MRPPVLDRDLIAWLKTDDLGSFHRLLDNGQISLFDRTEGGRTLTDVSTFCISIADSIISWAILDPSAPLNILYANFYEACSKPLEL
jgi:hypothetical protein